MTESTTVLKEEEVDTTNSTGSANTANSALASYFVPHFLPSTYSLLQRQAKTQLLMGSSCGIWLSYIVLSEHTAQAVAWVFLLGGLLLSSLSRWLSVRQDLLFRLEPRFLPDYSVQTRSAAPQKTEDCELEELAAPIIALISIALPLVLLASYLIFHIDFNQLHKPVVHRQVVDIELVAPTDVIDRKDILPSTSEKIINTAHKGALYTVASQTLAGAPTQKPQESTRANINGSRGAEDKPVTKAEPNSQTPPAQQKTSTMAAATTTQAAPIANSRTFLSEVEPVNMIESIDSDGQLSPLTIQSGGRSNGGAGAVSDLHDYLKLLNKKVKSHWIPPRGVDRIAVIEFRISADGRLLSAKRVAHGGDANGNIDVEAEAAAMSAITKSFPFQPLPAEVKAANLDVRYTFNYRFNQIDETGATQ